MKIFSLKTILGILCIALLVAWWGWSARFNVRKLISLHSGIRDYAVSSQGLVAVTGGSSAPGPERTIILINNNGSVNRVEVTSANGSIEGVNFSPDGRKLVGNTYGGLWIAEIEQTKITEEISTGPPATGNSNSWDSRDLSRPVLFHKGLVWCITSMNGDSSTLMASRWKTNNADFSDRKYVQLTQPTSYLRDQLVISPDGKKIAVLWKRFVPKGGVTDYRDRQGIIEVWETASGKKLCELEEIEPKGFGTLIFSPDSKYIAASDSVGIGYIWDTQSGQIIQTLSGLRHKQKDRLNAYNIGYDRPSFYPPINLVFTIDNRTVIAALNDGCIVAYNLESGLPFKILDKRNHPVSRLTVSPDNQKLYFIEDETPSQYDKVQRQTLYALPLPKFPEAS